MAAMVRREGRRGPWRLFLALLGLDRQGARVEALAGRWEAGAVGEQRTAELLEPLGREGWRGLHDRALPTGRANVDHVLIPPSGAFVVNVDSKLWSQRRGPVGVSRDSRLVHGGLDRQAAIRAVLHESRCVGAALGVPVVTVIAVHSAPVVGSRFRVEGVEVVQASLLVPLLRSLAGVPDRRRAGVLAARADRVLPRYVEGA